MGTAGSKDSMLTLHRGNLQDRAEDEQVEDKQEYKMWWASRGHS